jgi:glutathione S-transferase
MSTIKLHRFALSGHSHRVEVFLSLLGLDFDVIEVTPGDHKKPEFVAKNMFGQVPVIDDGDVSLSDSNAIITYLAAKYDAGGNWMPSDAVSAAQVQKFLSVAAGNLAFGAATARLANVFGATVDMEKAHSIANNMFAVFEAHLNGRQWLVGETATLADVANYSYIAHSPEGDISLEQYPNIRAWLARFETLQGFVPMQATAVGLAA